MVKIKTSSNIYGEDVAILLMIYLCTNSTKPLPNNSSARNCHHKCEPQSSQITWGTPIMWKGTVMPYRIIEMAFILCRI
jgi:hypothetical protein